MSSQNRIQQYYEELYWNERKGRNLGRVRDNLRGMQLRRGMRFIDVGCGLGATGVYLSSQGVISVGIDLSLSAARATRLSKGYAAALQANAEVLPFACLSFDGATFMGTLEHFLDPAKALREVSRVLKPRAEICFVVPNSHFFLFRFLGGTGQLYEVPRSYHGWQRLFESAGLSIRHAYRDIGPGVFEGGLLRGIFRKLVLLFVNLLPLHCTYQFVFVCQKQS